MVLVVDRRQQWGVARLEWRGWGGLSQPCGVRWCASVRVHEVGRVGRVWEEKGTIGAGWEETISPGRSLLAVLPPGLHPCLLSHPLSLPRLCQVWQLSGVVEKVEEGSVEVARSWLAVGSLHRQRCLINECQACL